MISIFFAENLKTKKAFIILIIDTVFFMVYNKSKEIFMLDFVFSTPTKVYFGKGRQKEVGKIVKEFGYKKVMIQYGKGSAVKSGLIDEVTTSLTQEGVDYVLMGGVEPNPKLNFVPPITAKLLYPSKNAIRTVLTIGHAVKINKRRIATVFFILYILSII